MHPANSSQGGVVFVSFLLSLGQASRYLHRRALEWGGRVHTAKNITHRCLAHVLNMIYENVASSHTCQECGRPSMRPFPHPKIQIDRNTTAARRSLVTRRLSAPKVRVWVCVWEPAPTHCQTDSSLFVNELVRRACSRVTALATHQDRRPAVLSGLGPGSSPPPRHRRALALTKRSCQLQGVSGGGVSAAEGDGYPRAPSSRHCLGSCDCNGVGPGKPRNELDGC